MNREIASEAVDGGFRFPEEDLGSRQEGSRIGFPVREIGMLRNGVPERFMRFGDLGCLREMLLAFLFPFDAFHVDFAWR